MKTSDLALLALGGFVLYEFILKPKQHPVQTMLPVSTSYPGASSSGSLASLLTNQSTTNSLVNLGTSLVSKLFPSHSPAPANNPGSSSLTASGDTLNYTPPASDTVFNASSITNLFSTPSFASVINTPPAGSIFSSDTDYLQSLEEEELYS